VAGTPRNRAIPTIALVPSALAVWYRAACLRFAVSRIIYWLRSPNLGRAIPLSGDSGRMTALVSSIATGEMQPDGGGTEVRTRRSEQARAARQRRIESHLPLARSVARRYAGRGEALDDLVQVGTVGLVKASNRFDEGRGVAFATFAARAIDGEIRRHLRDRSAALRVPRELHRTTAELQRTRSELTATLGRSPTVDELAGALATDEAHIERAMSAELIREPIPLIPGEEGMDCSASGEQQSRSEERLSLARSIRALDDRQREIIFLRFHADLTEREIARQLGISQAHVSRLLTSALARLRVEIEGEQSDVRGPDITAKEEISPRRAHVASSEQGSEAAPDGSPGSKRPGTMPGVRPSQQDRGIAHYLSLPYQVAVSSERGGEQPSWRASVEELPGCAARGRTPDEAVERLRPAMETWLATALAEHREIPLPPDRETVKPRRASTHSGRFLVRMPGTLHAKLAKAAEGEQVSLNRFVNDALTAAVTPAGSAGPREAIGPPSALAGTKNNHDRRPSRAFRLALATNAVVVVLAALAAIVLLALALSQGL
jgi:RNA polymerase sigma-B factor